MAVRGDVLKILVTGASGLLGAHLLCSLSRIHRVTGIDRQPWWGDREFSVVRGDLRDTAFVVAALRDADPDVLIHCAAMLDVDGCEQDPQAAFTMNAEVPRLLARSVRSDCLVVYISTDSLFSGDRGFATESTMPAPRSVYAQSKRKGEQAVEAVAARHLIVRTSFYGWSSGRKKTYGEWLHESLRTRQPVTLFTDVFFTPIYVMDLVDRISLLIGGPHRGYFHIAGKDRVSKYQFGQLLAQASHLSMDRVTAGSIDMSPLRAPRPKDMSLSSDHFRDVMGVDTPGCAGGISRFLADRQSTLSARCGSSPPLENSRN